MSPETFTLIAKDGQSFLVHSAILAAQSAPFRSIISGDWKESTERKISLEDWDSDTVGRFVEFLYTDNYRYPDPEPLYPEGDTGGKRANLESESESRATMEEDLCYDSEPEYGGLGQHRPLTPLDQCLDPTLRRVREKDVTEGKEQQQFGPFTSGRPRDYKAVLAAHAKVYALAQYKDIVALKALSLERLLVTLVSIHSNESCLDDHIAASIVELLEYVYSHTDSPGESEEPMRRVVSQFAALNFQALQSGAQMGELMREGGDFVKDLMGKVCRMLVVSGDELAEERGKRNKLDAKLKTESDTVKTLKGRILTLETSMEGYRKHCLGCRLYL